MKRFKIAVIPGDGIGPEVIEEGVKSTVLLTWPAAHSFEPGDSQFVLHGDLLPKGCLVQTKLVRNGKVLKTLILKQDAKGNFTGDWGKMEPGEAEMKVFAAVPNTGKLTCSQVFPVRFLKDKRSLHLQLYLCKALLYLKMSYW